jgi:hypothetical protein
VVEADRQQPLAGHVLDTAMSAPCAHMLVQVGHRLGQPRVMGGQHDSSGGRVTQGVEDRDALGRPQDHIEGGHSEHAESPPRHATGCPSWSPPARWRYTDTKEGSDQRRWIVAAAKCA